MRRLLLSLFLVLGTAAAASHAHDDGLIRLQVPAGFVGPTVEQMGPARISAYHHPWADDGRASLLQITRYDFGAQAAPPPAAQRGEAADRLVLQFLAGVQRRRQDFVAGAPQRLLLGGQPAARVEWRGRADDRPMRGAMYAVILGNQGLIFHAQDFDDAPPELLASARAAIEAMQLK